MCMQRKASKTVSLYTYIYSRVYILPFARSKVVANPLRACLGVFLTWTTVRACCSMRRNVWFYFICIHIRACVCVSNVGIERSRECGGGGVAGTAEHQHQGHVNVPARNGSGAGYMDVI